MNEYSFLYKICQSIEKEFDVICYAYKDGLFWYICIDDYNKYRSQEFKNFSSKYYDDIKLKSLNIRLAFCYCYPNEDKLVKLAEEDNLILITHS